MLKPKLQTPKGVKKVRKVIKVKTEKDLAKLYQKKKQGTFKILFTSLWDNSCKRLEKVVDKWKEQEGDELLYLINSWDLPASFSMYMITTVPALVHLTNGRVKVDIEFPTVYRFFDAS